MIRGVNQSNVTSLARKIWDYQLLDQKLEKADAILVLGSYNLRVPQYAAQLFLQGWAPLIIFSGKAGHGVLSTWSKSEAEMFADVAIKDGVPKHKIILEDRSTNTGENILFTKELLERNGINLRRFILVHKPYMERRTYATFKKLWPGKEAVVSSPPISFEEYMQPEHSKEAFVSQLVGDLQRIKLYAEKEWQIPQDIPKDVWESL
jgi:uncharacterized SAM-binding protein YcdF (DUF218 family)